jgi:prevent-host-death family protein
MRTIKSRQLRDNLAAVLRDVEAGEEIVIEQYNRPVARIIPYQETPVATFDQTRFALGIETDVTPTEYLQAHYPELTNLTDNDIYPGGNLARVVFTVEIDGAWMCAGMPFTNGAMEVYRRGTKAEVLKELDDILGG